MIPSIPLVLATDTITHKYILWSRGTERCLFIRIRTVSGAIFERTIIFTRNDTVDTYTAFTILALADNPVVIPTTAKPLFTHVARGAKTIAVVFVTVGLFRCHVGTTPYL